MALIAFAGFARSGKDEAASPLLKAGWDHQAFANRLRELLIAINPILWDRATETHTDVRRRATGAGWDYIKDYCGGREMMQRLGEEARAILGQDIWVRPVMKYYAEFGGNVVIPDVRYRPEVAAIEEAGGVVYRITRPGVGPVNDHSSELDLVGFDLPEIHNDGSIQDLHDKVVNLARWML